MRRRRWMLVGVMIVGTAVLAGGACVSGTGASRVTESNFGRIKQGMSRAEVEAILGPPSPELPGPPTPFQNTQSGKPDGTRSEVVLSWRKGEDTIFVGFDRSNRVDAYWNTFTKTGFFGGVSEWIGWP